MIFFLQHMYYIRGASVNCFLYQGWPTQSFTAIHAQQQEGAGVGAHLPDVTVVSIYQGYNGGMFMAIWGGIEVEGIRCWVRG